MYPLVPTSEEYSYYQTNSCIIGKQRALSLAVVMNYKLFPLKGYAGLPL